MKKTERIEIRLTPEEKTMIINNSVKTNTTISEYLIKSATKKEIVVINDLDKLVIQLRKLGNNVNQLTKLANGRVITCVELGGVKKELSKIWQSLNSLITRSD
ncbi:plasmid mobilization relaxosome protein MobC [bacterium]|nr:plasmid mobilization relaxosome protein MobC [bacterium]